jgi:protein-S-isoprenylcysteine O-methyltransferase Ste14
MDSVTLGGWLFRQRTWLPVPLALALLLIPAPPVSRAMFWIGAAGVAGGELLRLWGVSHIGVVSRTRSDRLGPLIDTGPFARVRNPLYVGNVLLWVGFALSAGLAWLAPIFAVLLGLEYHAIVRWEERLLESRMGDAYRRYMARVPRWVPAVTGGSERTPATAERMSSSPVAQASGFSWRETLFSERGTLIAIGVGYGLLAVKDAVLRS